MCAAASVTLHGYKCQELEVKTDDGYILSVQRIPAGHRTGVGSHKRPPVLLQHGVLVTNRPENPLRRPFDGIIDSVGFVIKRKLRQPALLSPIAYLSHMKTNLGVVAAKAFVGEITTMFGIPEFNPKGDAVANFLNALCANPGLLNCYDLLTVVTGKNCCLNSSTVEFALKYEPQPTATKNFVHFAQTVRDGLLSKYDYGNADHNLKHYGESTPPGYDLSKIPRDFPLFLSNGGQDTLSDVKDVGTLLEKLKSHKQDKLHVQYVKDYAHIDFVLGVTAKEIVYDKIIAFFRRHS